ncbi:MAG: DUF5372 family protein, partial [Opitutaceae bacterium]
MRICYPWHPLCGQDLPVIKRFRRIDAVCVRSSDGTTLTVPAWMC